jgi:hypothetical protein
MFLNLLPKLSHKYLMINNYSSLFGILWNYQQKYVSKSDSKIALFQSNFM